MTSGDNRKGAMLGVLPLLSEKIWGFRSCIYSRSHYKDFIPYQPVSDVVKEEQGASFVYTVIQAPILKGSVAHPSCQCEHPLN